MCVGRTIKTKMNEIIVLNKELLEVLNKETMKA